MNNYGQSPLYQAYHLFFFLFDPDFGHQDYPDLVAKEHQESHLRKKPYLTPNILDKSIEK